MNDHLRVRLDAYSQRASAHRQRLRWAAWYVLSVLIFESRWPWPSRIKCAILRLFGARIGVGVVIKPNVKIKFPWNLEIGDYVWIGEQVWIDNLDTVVVGSHVCISQGAYLLTGNHDYKKVTFDLITRPIKIHDGAWIGARALIAPGVVIADHSVIYAGTVVSKDTEPFSIYQSQSATKIRQRIIQE
ncbi:MAG: WcaF family extracellular polysaccharide biosynthesis acetyltransferase [Methylacidiphilales bacterium]|nr:WcaF family extracellular polysaccharide biosynthesis acetyltransferase [Candidatus Methylacidiphilales bacterium]